MSIDHEPIVNQFVELIYGVGSIEAEDNAKYAQALLVIAGADGEITKPEWDWFIGRGRAMGVPEFVLESFRSFDWRSARLQDYAGDNRAVARILLYDAITMSSADGYSEAEAVAVRQAAMMLGVRKDVVDALEGIIELEETLRGMRHRILRSAMY